MSNELDTTPGNSLQLGKQVLIVIGMHRSGISATTGALQCLGVQLGEKLYWGITISMPRAILQALEINDRQVTKK